MTGTAAGQTAEPAVPVEPELGAVGAAVQEEKRVTRQIRTMKKKKRKNYESNSLTCIINLNIFDLSDGWGE